MLTSCLSTRDKVYARGASIRCHLFLSNGVEYCRTALPWSEVAGFSPRFLNTDSDLEHAAFVVQRHSLLIVVIVESVEKGGELIQIVALREGIAQALANVSSSERGICRLSM